MFSIVIATYNYGHLIERAVNSVLNQTVRDYEIIVVDDGSTDDTPQRMTRFDERVRYVRKENGGQSSAYNLGADLARGEFVYILDADDELFPDTLKVFADAIQGARDAGQDKCIFYGGYESVGIDGKRRTRTSVPAPAEPLARLKAFIEKKIVGLQNGAFVIPRQAFEKLRYPERIRHNTDLVFIGQALTFYPATAINAVVLVSHAHPLRSRKRRANNIAHGTTPVECLFDPATIDKKFLPLKRDFLSARLCSLGRMNFLDAQYTQAKQAYRAAFRAKPTATLKPGTVKRWIASEICSVLKRDAPD